MFNHNHYVPILKWKRGERTALEKVEVSLKEYITPLIEIQPVPFNHASGMFSKTLDDHLNGIGEQVNSAWTVDRPIFIDTNTIYHNEDFSDDSIQSGQHFLESIIDDIESNGTAAIPVTGLYRYPEFHQAVKSIHERYGNGICIRLEESDLVDISTLHNDIDNLIDFLGIERNKIDIVMDYKQVLPQQTSSHLNNIILTIVQMPYLLDWRTLTIASTAYPSTLKQIPTNSTGSLPRSEWNIYNKLRKCGLARIPSFSDYNVSHPDFVNLDPRIINMAAGIKYTAENEFLVLRGVGIKNTGFGQMVQICNSLINHPDYYGKSFSYGDQYINDCANQNVTTGNPERWVIVGVNHHLTVVAQDCATHHAVSAVDLLSF